jgi:hypothetical protein
MSKQNRAYTVEEMIYVLKTYDFKKSEERAIAWFIQTLINHDFDKDPPKKLKEEERYERKG